MSAPQRGNVQPQPPRPAVKVLIAINVAVYVAWQLLGRDGPIMADHFLVSSAHLGALRFWTLVTSAFSHVAPEHLLFNLFALWVFGRHVEGVIGSRGLVNLYLAGGVVASLGHVAFNIASGDPTPALGASGAVMAIAVVFALLFPRVKLLLFFLIPMPAIAAVGLFVLLVVVVVVSGGSSIAHAAHLGGVIYGGIYYRFHIRPRLRR